MAGPRQLISADQARRLLMETPAVGTERVSLEAAAGRVLAAALEAPEDLPPAARSVMDGYAVRAADVAAASDAAPVRLAIAGAVPMGGAFPGPVGPGQAVAIPTGGTLPDGADAVVMVEHTRPGTAGAAVEVLRPVAAGRNVIQAGEDLRRGDPVLPAGRRLRPQDLAALAAFGIVEPLVYRRPRVAICATGNELCDPAVAPGPGQVRNSNQYVLAAQAAAAGCDVTHGGIVSDDEDALRAAIGRLLPAHDALILSGGTSVGVRDLVADALAELEPPGIIFHGVDIRPGKPTLFARAGAKPVVGMPGFPTSGMIVFDAFIRPMLWRLGGEAGRDPWPARRGARLARAYASAPGREDYLRVKLATRADDLWAEVLPGGSAAISNVVFADGLVIVPASVEAVAQGAPVEVLLYPAS